VKIIYLTKKERTMYVCISLLKGQLVIFFNLTSSKYAFNMSRKWNFRVCFSS